MSTDSQKLTQLLNGRWVGIMGDFACELHFGTIGLADPQFSGQIVIKRHFITYDKSNQDHKIIKLDIFNIYDQFGSGYIAFNMDGSTVVAMVSRKSLTLKGHRKIKVMLRLQHKLMDQTTNENHTHRHLIQQYLTYYQEPCTTVTGPFFIPVRQQSKRAIFLQVVGEIKQTSKLDSFIFVELEEKLRICCFDITFSDVVPLPVLGLYLKAFDAIPVEDSVDLADVLQIDRPNYLE